MHYRLGAMVEAERCYGKALPMQRTVGDVRSIGITVANLGEVARMQGRHEAALTLLDEAITTHEASSFLAGEADAWGNLAHLRLDMGQPTVALDCLERAFDRAERGNAMWNEAFLCLSLAIAHMMNASPDAAITALDRAEAAGGMESGVAVVRGELALDAGRIDEAITHFERGVAIDPDSDSKCLLAIALVRSGEIDRAAALLADLPPGALVDVARVGIDRTLAEARAAVQAGPVFAVLRRALARAEAYADGLVQAAICSDS
jgi:tetratricopeptide (TPR) repeat protein